MVLRLQNTGSVPCRNLQLLISHPSVCCSSRGASVHTPLRDALTGDKPSCVCVLSTTPHTGLTCLCKMTEAHFYAFDAVLCVVCPLTLKICSSADAILLKFLVPTHCGLPVNASIPAVSQIRLTPSPLIPWPLPCESRGPLCIVCGRTWCSSPGLCLSGPCGSIPPRQAHCRSRSYGHMSRWLPVR